MLKVVGLIEVDLDKEDVAGCSSSREGGFGGSGCRFLTGLGPVFHFGTPLGLLWTVLFTAGKEWRGRGEAGLAGNEACAWPLVASFRGVGMPGVGCGGKDLDEAEVGATLLAFAGQTAGRIGTGLET